jgi:HEAT repeat protein
MFVSGPFGPSYRYPTQHIAAAEAIGEIGTNAVPHLLRTIYSRDPPWVTKLATVWRKQKWVKLPFKTAIEKQEHALPALRELGPAVVWTWVEILTNQSAAVEVQQYAAGSLAEMRRGAVPALATLLEFQNHTNYTMRVSIGAAIQYCDTEGFLSSLYNLRHATNSDVRASAAWSLGYICKNPDMSIPALARAAKDHSPKVRASALEALGKFAADALDTTNIVVRALEDPERRVRRAATNALNRIIPPTDANPRYKGREAL